MGLGAYLAYAKTRTTGFVIRYRNSTWSLGECCLIHSNSYVCFKIAQELRSCCWWMWKDRAGRHSIWVHCQYLLSTASVLQARERRRSACRQVIRGR